MYELHPYFTNDGSVGLFSPQDDDIYHSTYGALTESWQKFIIPSHFEQYLATHSEVKVLDICYGIGYNTKTALNVFIKNALKTAQNNIKNNNKFESYNHSNAAIDADNISQQKKISTKQVSCIKYDKNNFDGKEIRRMICYSIETIHTDNISQEKVCTKDSKADSKSSIFCNKILIDAVDIDKILINLSPFISTEAKNETFLKQNEKQNIFNNENKNDKLLQIQQIQKTKNNTYISLPKKFRLRQEVSIIILEKLLKNNPDYLNEPFMQAILNQKKYSPYFSKFMLNLAKFYQNNGYNHNKSLNKTAFLHNIYYRYVSKSYKNVEKLLKNSQIDLNLHKNDARHFIKSTNNTYNFIFLDAFTPSKCPALWSLEFLKELYSKLDDDGMILTYSNSAAIRNAFLQNGFHVGKIIDQNSKKAMGTIAVKNYSLIENELNEKDLALMSSRAGICFRDENLELDNKSIIENRENEIRKSELISSSKALKGDYSVK